MAKEITKQGKILFVDDNEDLLEAARLNLRRHFLKIDVAVAPEYIPDKMNNEDYDVILLDMNFTKDVSSGKEGFEWLNRILEIDPLAVVILVTAYGDVEMAVKAIKEGATDFILKPWESKKLQATIHAAIKLRASRIETAKLRSYQEKINADMDHPFQDIIGQSEAMIKLYETINRVARTDANVLILGENGTGKELVARALHRNSLRNTEVFMKVDMGALMETLFESELFGHVKGAFTDAKEHKAGRFEIADQGTLFLDEIGNLSLPLQAKLLSVLESREVTRVGANKSTRVDVRTIFATNMNLYDMVAEKSFREDLLYRINTIEIQIPPLRQRIDDIPLLAGYFLDHYAHKYQKKINPLREPILKRMQKYYWPGNIRELRHVIERAVIMCNSHNIEVDDLHISNRKPHEQDANNLHVSDFNLEHVEKLVIDKVLQSYHGNITYAADELGLTRTSLYRRIEKYGL